MYASNDKSEQKQKPQKFSIGRVGREKRVKGGELLLCCFPASLYRSTVGYYRSTVGHIIVIYYGVILLITYVKISGGKTDLFTF